MKRELFRVEFLGERQVYYVAVDHLHQAAQAAVDAHNADARIMGFHKSISDVEQIFREGSVWVAEVQT